MKTIIEMAGKAFETPGVEPAFRNGFWTVTSEELERFAELIRADERERFLQAVEEMRPAQNNPLLQNKPPEFWIRSFKQAIEARGNT